MAARDGDVALWLHNKLGSTDDLWSGSSICSQLTREKLLNTQDCFHNLQPHVKVKLMLSFLHLPKRNAEEWRVELEEVLALAQDDTDQWVAIIGNILRLFPESGNINADVDNHHGFFHEVLADLKKLVRKTQDVGMTPMECCYLSRSAQQSITGSQQQPVKHFALKRKPKSAALRAELLQKSTEAANHLKKTGGVTVPLKIRSFAKKMDDNSPMRGIPSSRVPSSAGFLRSNSLSRSFGGNSSISQRSGSQREGGIKLLDIKDMPVGAKEAKRRRKQAEQEALELQKKEKEAQAATPDYAAGLGASGVGPLPPPVEVVPLGPSYVPTQVNKPTTTTTTISVTLPVSSISMATQQARDNLQTQLHTEIVGSPMRAQLVAPGQLATLTPGSQLIQQGSQIIVTQATPVTPQQMVVPPLHLHQQPPVIQQTLTQQQILQNNSQVAGVGLPQVPQHSQPKKGLKLTREQMLAAQDMFRNSNKVTRPEKALILGFIAGSRENPCPSQGDIVNIRLSEDHDSIQQPDMTFKPMVVDTYIQMNYNTGEWRKLKKYREKELDPEVE